MLTKLRLSRALLFLSFLFLFGSELAYSGITDLLKGSSETKIDFTIYDTEKEVIDFVLNEIAGSDSEEVNIFIADPQSTFSKHSFIQNFGFRYSLFPNRDIVDCCSAPLKVYDYSSFSQLIQQKKINYIIAPVGFGSDLQYLDQSFGELEQIKMINGYAIFQYRQPTISTK